MTVYVRISNEPLRGAAATYLTNVMRIFCCLYNSCSVIYGIFYGVHVEYCISTVAVQKRLIRWLSMIGALFGWLTVGLTDF